MPEFSEVLKAAEVITKEVMIQYEEVRVGGKCNMFDLRCVRSVTDYEEYYQLAALTSEEYLLCIKFYSELMELHGLERQ